MPDQMTAVGMERKLTAIFSTDVAGYSRLMGDDEEATIRTLTAYREVISSLIQSHRGRVVDAPGDNLLAEFASVVDAVRCAVEIQQSLKTKNAELPEHRQMRFRIGINLGDVIVEGERLYGDGVNIAARLESLAIPGGIYLSSTVYDQVENKLPLQYTYQGEQAVKNIAKPVRVYRVELDGPSPFGREGQDERATTEADNSTVKVQSAKATASKASVARRWVAVGLVLLAAIVGTARYWAFPLSHPHPTPSTQALFPLPDKPSIAILPFTNMSSDPEQEYFSDGITEDIITDLSKLSGLFVIARNSTFVYKGKRVKIADVSYDLGVRYVLEGSVRKAGDRLRINAQLVDATTSYHLWSERYDRDLKDIFAVQDEITQKIVEALKVKLTEKEQEYVIRRNTTNLEAYDSFLRGWAYYLRYTKEANLQARQMYERAVGLDPGYADAYAGLASTYWLEWAVQWNPVPQNLERALELAQKAIALDSTLPTGHVVLGVLYLWRNKQSDHAIAELEQALALDPNNADAYWILAEILNFSGMTDRMGEALELLEKAMRLNPHYPAPYVFNVGAAYQKMGRYEEAIAAHKRAIALNPDYQPPHIYLAVIYSESGREEEAHAEVAEVLRMSPTFSLDLVRKNSPTKDQAGLERFIAALRKAELK